jgi:hypothetical protein
MACIRIGIHICFDRILYTVGITFVSDPDSFIPDPDPAF